MITKVISRRAFASWVVSISLATATMLLVDLTPEFARQAGHALQFLAGGGKEALRGAEMLQQRALAGRADALQRVEDGTGHRPVAAAAVVFDREAVGLVADPLQELVALRGAR
jgi:ABC-type tungstate transport system permease subunit